MVLAFGPLVDIRAGRWLEQLPLERIQREEPRNPWTWACGEGLELAAVEQQCIGRRVLAFSSLWLWTWFTSGSATSYPQPLRNVAEGVSIGCNRGIKPSRQQGRTSHSPVAMHHYRRFCLWSTFRQGDDSSNCLLERTTSPTKENGFQCRGTKSPWTWAYSKGL